MVSGSGYDSLVDANTRQLHNVNSPLQIFVKAKKNINDIFGDISDYVVETTSFIEGKMSLHRLSMNYVVQVLTNFYYSSACRKSRTRRHCGQS